MQLQFLNNLPIVPVFIKMAALQARPLKCLIYTVQAKFPLCSKYEMSKSLALSLLFFFSFSFLLPFVSTTKILVVSFLVSLCWF